jgi:Flp pilus assembly protein TadD
MPRFTAPMGALALSALLCGTAAAGTPEPTPATVTMMQSVDAGVREAQLKRVQRDYAGAIRVLSQLMLVAPDDARVVGEYGKVLVQQGRARDAGDFLNRAVQLQPGDWTLFSALGIAYDQTGDYPNARAAYERALVLKPGETVVLNNYAMSRMLAGDLAQAKRLIAQAAATSKDERITRNVKLIDGLNPPAVAAATPPKSVPASLKSVTAPTVAQRAPRVLVQPLPTSVVMQAVPVDPKAGKVGRVTVIRPTTANKPVKTAAKPTPSSGIPALRLANDRK